MYVRLRVCVLMMICAAATVWPPVCLTVYGAALPSPLTISLPIGCHRSGQGYVDKAIRVYVCRSVVVVVVVREGVVLLETSELRHVHSHNRSEHQHNLLCGHSVWT